MKLTKSYSKRMTKDYSKLAFDNLKNFKELKNASKYFKIFYIINTNGYVDDYLEDNEQSSIWICGFNLDLTQHVFDLILDYNEGKYVVGDLEKYKDKIVCHPHIFVNPKYRGLGIMASILDIYYKNNHEFVFSAITREGLTFIKKWYKKNNIKFSFFDVNGIPRRENDKRVFYLGSKI